MRSSLAEMDGDQARELDVLEGILSDPSAEFVKLSYGLLKYSTGGFSNQIGQGGFGVVYQGDVDNEMIAVKMISNAHGFSDKEFMDEITCLMMAKHKNIVRFLGYCADTQGEIMEHNGSYVMSEVHKRLLCFEYVPNGNIQQYLELEKPHRDNWPIRYQIIRGICHGLHCLHDKQICHLDLRPEKVMLDDQMEPKLIGFALSRIFGEGESRMFTKNTFGTRGYIAPELISHGEISLKSDIYAFGIIIIKLLSGNDTDLNNWDESLDVDCTGVRKCAEIARKCMDLDRHNRPTLHEVISDLEKLESMIPQPSVNQKTSQRLKLAISTQQHRRRVSPVKITREAINRRDLEHMLHHKDAEPGTINFLLLKKITNNFCEERKIGSGGFGEVYKGVLSDESIVAVKRLFTSKAYVDGPFQNEVECLMKVKHRNIARFLGYCALLKGEMVPKPPNDKRRILANNPEKLLCFEYLSNGNLRSQLKDASCGPEWHTRYLMIKGICDGLNHLHDNRIIHLDLKPENILLDNDMIPKIVDFGLSRLLDEEKSLTRTLNIIGSRGYMAPEYWTGGIITFPCDIYSLGVILIEMVTGHRNLLSIENELEIWAHRLGAPEAHKTTLEQVKVCLEIGKECVDHNPESRPVIQDIMRRLDEAETYNCSPGNAASTSSV